MKSNQGEFRLAGELLDLYNKNNYISKSPKELSLSPSSTSTSTHDLAVYKFQNVVKTDNYGCFHNNGDPIIPSFLRRGDGTKSGDYPYGMPIKVKNPNNYAPMETSNIKLAFYVNYLNFAHFGHFLTECISSIYPILYWRNNIDEITIIVDKEFKEFYHHLAKIIGISASTIKVPGVNCSQLLIETRLVPKPTVINRSIVSKSHSIVVKKYLELVYPREYVASKGKALECKNYIYLEASYLKILEVLKRKGRWRKI